MTFKGTMWGETAAFIEARMAELGIERIVRTDAGYHVWLFGTWLAEHCGRGATLEEATGDAFRRTGNLRGAA